MIQRRRVYGMVTGLLVCSMLGILGRDASAAEEQARQWKWYGVWGIPNCVYPCNPVNEGCNDDPDCKCDCYQ